MEFLFLVERLRLRSNFTQSERQTSRKHSVGAELLARVYILCFISATLPRNAIVTKFHFVDKLAEGIRIDRLIEAESDERFVRFWCPFGG